MQCLRLFRQAILAVFKTKHEAARVELRFINQTRQRHFDKPSYNPFPLPTNIKHQLVYRTKYVVQSFQAMVSGGCLKFGERDMLGI